MSAQLSMNFPTCPPRGIQWEGSRAVRAYRMLRDGEPTGVHIRHCGHPTALRPYYVETPTGDVVERKFSTLAKAKLAAVMIHEDRYTDEAWRREAFA